MDFKVLLTSFLLIFLSELGDKTQLATLAFASWNPSKFSIFLGASAALVLSSALAVLLGELVSKYIPIKWMHVTAGLMFIGIGIFMLANEFKS